MPVHHTHLTFARPGFLGGAQWHLRALNSITVLLGKNGSGKSLMLRAIRSADRDSRHYIVPERTGEISFDAGMLLDVLNSGGRANRSSTNFSPSYRQEVVTRIQGYYTRRGTKDRAQIEHDPKDLLRLMEFLLPDFKVGVKAESPFYELTRIRDGAFITSVSNLSSGESQLVSLGLDVLTIVGMWQLDKQQSSLLLIDEPDAHIHPDLQIKLADFICRVESTFKVQIIIATHSMTLLAALAQFARERLSVVYVSAERAEMTADRFAPIMKELTAFLGGHLVLGPLFAAPTMLVEGDDDYRVWVHVARGPTVRLCVLPCNGDEIRKYQRTLERMFHALSEDAQLRGIALVDGDVPVPQASERNPQQFVRFMKLACRETENLYLTDEVLAILGHTWESAKARIIAEADTFGAKSESLKAIAGADRRTADIKPIIGEIAEILDQPKKLLWSMRVGKCLAERAPTGMLREWLGDCANYLWPI